MKRPGAGKDPWASFVVAVVAVIGLFQRFQPTGIAMAAGTVLAIVGAISYIRFGARYREELARARRPVGALGHALLFVLATGLSFVAGSHGIGVLWTTAAGDAAERVVTVDYSEWHQGSHRSRSKNCYRVTVKGARLRDQLGGGICLQHAPRDGSKITLVGKESAWGFWYPEEGIRPPRPGKKPSRPATSSTPGRAGAAAAAHSALTTGR